MSETHRTSPDGPDDLRIGLLLRALELSGVEPLIAASLARENYLRIRRRGRRFEVTDSDGKPYDGEDPILHLAQQIKQGIPEKFLTESVLDRERDKLDNGAGGE